MYAKLTETGCQEQILKLNKMNDSASTTKTSLTRTRAAKQSRPEPPQLPHVGRHVGEAPGAGTEIAERNEFETVLQTLVRSA